MFKTARGFSSSQWNAAGFGPPRPLSLHPPRAVFSAGQVLTVLNVVKGGTDEDGEEYGDGEVFHGSISVGLNTARQRFIHGPPAGPDSGQTPRRL